MKRTSVESSNLVSAGYDSLNELLEVEFKGGQIYHYIDVPSAIWRDFQSVVSKGKFLREKVIGTYKVQKVKKADDNATSNADSSES